MSVSFSCLKLMLQGFQLEHSHPFQLFQCPVMKFELPSLQLHSSYLVQVSPQLSACEDSSLHSNSSAPSLLLFFLPLLLPLLDNSIPHKFSSLNFLLIQFFLCKPLLSTLIHNKTSPNYPCSFSLFSHSPKKFSMNSQFLQFRPLSYSFPLYLSNHLLTSFSRCLLPSRYRIHSIQCPYFQKIHS